MEKRQIPIRNDQAGTPPEQPADQSTAASVPSPAPAPSPADAAADLSAEEWRDRALRLQAEMENYRKRQRRIAEEQVRAERERLLRAFLSIVDNLERALSPAHAQSQGLREGVELTYRALKLLLAQEGVEAISAAGQAFDPAWHEAVGSVYRPDLGVEPGTVVEVEQKGYRLGDRLLRPARVLVAGS